MAEEKKALRKEKEREKSSFERRRHDQDWKVCEASGGAENEVLYCYSCFQREARVCGGSKRNDTLFCPNGFAACYSVSSLAF